MEFVRSEYEVEVEENTKVPNLLQLSVRVQPHGESERHAGRPSVRAALPRAMRTEVMK